MAAPASKRWCWPNGRTFFTAHSPCLWGQAAFRVARRHKCRWPTKSAGCGKMRPSIRAQRASRRSAYLLSRALETRVVREATVVATIADHLKDELAERGIPREKIHLVPNGVDAATFLPRQPDAQLASSLNLNGHVRVGYVGTLYPWEGVEVMLQAVPRIVAQSPNVRFLIIGGGKQADALRGMIDDLGIGALRHVCRRSTARRHRPLLLDPGYIGLSPPPDPQYRTRYPAQAAGSDGNGEGRARQRRRRHPRVVHQGDGRSLGEAIPPISPRNVWPDCPPRTANRPRLPGESLRYYGAELGEHRQTLSRYLWNGRRKRPKLFGGRGTPLRNRHVAPSGIRNGRRGDA